MRDGHEDARLSAFLDDELGDHEALEVTRHLARCPRCLDELEGLRRARSAVRGLPGVEPPVELFDEVAVAAAVPPRRRLASAAIAGLAVGITLHLMVGADGAPPTTPLEGLFVEPMTGASLEPVIAPAELGP